MVNSEDFVEFKDIEGSRILIKKDAVGYLEEYIIGDENSTVIGLVNRDASFNVVCKYKEVRSILGI